MTKNKLSVRSAGKLHIPATYDQYPYKPMDPPVPLCSMFMMGEVPEWSPMPPTCEACERAKILQDRRRELQPLPGQMVMDVG